MKKKLILVSVMVLFVMLFAGCTQNISRDQIMFPNRIERVTVGQELKLIPAIYGGKGTLVFTSEDEEIVSLSGDIATGVAEGTTRIVVCFAEDESVRDELEIIVTQIAGTSMLITAESNIVVTGMTLQLTSSAVPSYATQTVTWSSSNEEIATVDVNTGVVTGVEEGNVIITATSTVDITLVARFTVKVNDYVTATSIEIKNTESELYAGQTLQMQYEAKPLEITSPNVIWSVGVIGDTGTATISQTGLLSGRSAGNVTVMVRDPYDSSIRATYSLLIKFDEPVSLNITVPIYTKKIGQKVQLSAVVDPSTANQTVTWTSSDDNIATISEAGLVSLISFGSATFTATSVEDNNITATYTISDIPEATGIVVTFTGEYPLVNGGTLQLVATVNPSTVNQAVIWSSSNEGAATVDPITGIVTRVNVYFEVNIIATSVEYPSIKAEFKILATI